ncbi:hypothetical protein FDA94_29105 [Herbidospora galbida]|uniref:Uncharacterized protein n=1 Tax=Herbidospora galbida TaxID=2575442 RepID=A0A4U3M9D5_9ACTN|nr:hypothetical protein [Herbidospora galbida]TKK84674.1 hypothetical protein FDA94_29105 [Herbidospora galbida]
MPRVLTRTPLARVDTSHQRILALLTEKKLLDDRLARDTKRRAKVVEELHEIALREGTRDSKGGQRVVLPEELSNLPGAPSGYRRSRSVSTRLNEADVLRLARRKGLTNRIVKTREVEVIDPDELWVALQEGAITRQDIDACMDRDYTYSIRGL